MQLGYFLVAFALFALASANHLAPPGGPIRNKDVYVATNGTDGVFFGGKYCKDPFLLSENDFSTSGLGMPGNTNNIFGSSTTPANVEPIPGLNGLGVSMERVDYASQRDSGSRVCDIKPKLYTHYRKVLTEGDVYVFPKGLVHYQRNIGNKQAVAILAFSSESPGSIVVPKAIFSAKPFIPIEVLVKSFQLARKIVASFIAIFLNVM